MAFRLKALGARYTPALWAFSVWVAIAPFVTFLQFVDPAIWFAAVGFWLAGLVFVYDGIHIWPKKGKFIGLTPSIMLIVIGSINVGLGFMVILDFFNPYVGDDELRGVATITLGLGVIALFITGTIDMIFASSTMKRVKEALNK